MKIIKYDGSELFCEKVEFGDVFVIVDDTDILGYAEIQRIVND